MDCTEAELGKLPIKDILRRLLVKRIIADGSPELIHALRTAAIEHQQQKVSQRRDRKRRKEEEEQTVTGRKVPRLDEAISSDIATPPTTFLQVPSTEELHGCYRSFHVATSNNAIAFGTCGV